MVLVNHVLGLFLQPHKEWRSIRDNDKKIWQIYAELVLFLAFIPPFAGYYGTTEIGWRFGIEDPQMLTKASALNIAILYYLGLLIAVFLVGKALHWMAPVYDANPTLAQSVKVAALSATPLFLVGLMQFYPTLWINFLLGLPALAFSVYLLFTGMPIVMGIPKEQAFLLSSSLLTFGMVALVASLAGIVILWSLGLEPVLAS